jgi:DNA-binding CsgD family transcriptional regulator
LEQDYKILGSRRVLVMLADDLEQLHQEYFPERNRLKFGDLVWQTTKDDGQRPSYGKKTEDYAVQTVILPLVRKEDIEQRIFYHRGVKNEKWRRIEEREMEQLERLVKSAKSQGGLLSGAEVALMMNLSLGTVGKYLRRYYERHKEVLPMKGYVLDQGSNPTHKGIIIELYEQAISPADIVLKTGHTQEAVDRYIRGYDQVLALSRKKHDAVSISQITGRSINIVRQYLRLVKDFYPGLQVTVPERQPGKPRHKNLKAKKHKKK